MAAMPSDAGELVVTGQATGKDNWYLKNNEVLASQKFTLQILNQKYGNCQTGFSNQSVNVSADAISVQFLITTDPKVVCIMDVRPHGPTFEMAPLKLGKYPIYITELLPCEVKAPFCAVDRIQPTVSDTLIVSAALTTIIRGRAAATPTVRFEGRQLQLEMPESKNGSLGQRIWKAEVLTLSGQVRESHQFTVSAAGSMQLDIGTQIERGVYFIRLHAPSGVTHTLPVVRKD
jgi:hypothetical protein